MTVTETMVKAAARAMHNCKAWPVVFESGSAETLARTALTAALSDQVVVPAEPTKEMAEAGRKATAVVADRMEEAKLLATSIIDFWQRVGHEPANEIYRAMIAAAPPPDPSSTILRGE